ncbi:unnamed protein product [Cuscuta campestris]|uniref:AAA+ ATPase domain-containing protein n=1 Tax=Cuscuta campestris TaxID=132261 RepID=A0A484M9W4_9ASTE|nr:unnamed protein product [Cuscuta campestris]
MRRFLISISPGFVRRTSDFSCSALRFYCDRPHPGVLAYYKSLVDQGKLQHDPSQEKVAFELENLLGRLKQYEKDMEEYHFKLAKWEEERENERRRLLMEEAKQQDMPIPTNNHQGVLKKWIYRKKPANVETGVGKWVSYLNREKKLDSVVGRCPSAPPAPKGLYLFGNVGSGKTMLMDMFYGATKGIVKHRRRFHFHEAMLEIHQYMHRTWKNQVEQKSLQSNISGWFMNLPFDTKVKEWIAGEEKYKQDIQMQNVLLDVADKFLIDQQGNKGGASILCFDEIQTVDVFAIVALSGIVSRLLSKGTVLVATSNREPRDLNQDGMQWEIFDKLVLKLEEHCKCVLIGSEIDYRRLIAQRSIEQAHYFWLLDSKSKQLYEDMWSQVTKKYGGKVTSEIVQVMFGRTLEVSQSCNGVARFTFEYLCGQPTGAADYIAIANNYHTVFISDIPVMSMRIRDKARRFITLIDELYNHHCCLYCSAEASVDDLFQGTEEGTLFDLESFQFETETEGGRLRRDVLAEGGISSGGSPTGIISMLSGQEEMFAFRRAVSRLIEMQSRVYLDGTRHLHPYFQSPRRNLQQISAN